MKIKNVQIQESTIKEWVQAFRPEFDLYFFSSAHESILESFAENSLIMPEQEFDQHSSYQDINIVNSYEYWGLSKEIEYVCVSPSLAITTFDEAQRIEILQIQKEMNSNLIYEWEFVKSVVEELTAEIESIRNLLNPYLFEYHSQKYIAIPAYLWRSLPFVFQQAFLMKLASLYIDERPLDKEWYGEIDQYPHISKYVNTFGSRHGANCLSATLAALANNKEQADWIISQWAHQETFLLRLKYQKYEVVHTSLENLVPKDVIAWRNEQDVVKHATFHLGNGYFFNKNGQSFFNPWQIITLDALLKNWGTKRIQIYRKK